MRPGARADSAVIARHSRLRAAALRAHGADASVIDVGPVDHRHSLVLALPELLTWFLYLR